MTSHNLVLFENARDNTVRVQSQVEWSDLVDIFSQHELKADKDSTAFILGKFKTVAEGASPARTPRGSLHGTVGRYKENLLHSTALCLDYDNEEPLLDEAGRAVKVDDKTVKVQVLSPITIDQARQSLLGLTQLGYTSFNHLKPYDYSQELLDKHERARQSQGKPAIKFRIVVPLKSPAAPAEIEARKQELLRLFAGCDSSSFSAAHIFYTPATPGGREVLTWHEAGEDFDLLALPTVAFDRLPTATACLNFEAADELLKQAALCHFTTYEDWRGLGSRLYNAGFDLSDYQALSDGDAKTQRDCASLWRWFERQGAPSGPGPLIKRIRDEYPTWQVPEKPEQLTLIKGEHSAASEDEAEQQEPRETVKVLRTFSPPTALNLRKSTIRDFTSRFLRNPVAAHAVLRTAEGYGKSTMLVEELLRQGKDILFCCSSNAQANEKVEAFASHGAVRVWSRRGLIEAEYGVKVVQVDAPEWSVPAIDLPATIERIIEKTGLPAAEIEARIEELAERAAASRASRARLLVTTFASGSILFKKAYGKLDRVIIVDDPSMGDLLRFKYDFVEEDGAQKLKQVATRPVEEVIFGQAFDWQDKIIWTTTEKLVLSTIAVQHEDVLLTDLTESIETGDNCLLIPTPLVRKRLKPIIGGIHQTICKITHEERLYFANGDRGANYNLVSSKGRNDLTSDAIIAISYPHPCDLAAVTATLGLPLGDALKVRPQLIADICDQAIGRAQGYRECGAKTLIVCDPHLEASLRLKSRYRLNTNEGLNRQVRLKGVPKTWSMARPDWWSWWFGYLEVWHKYVQTRPDGKVCETLSLEQFSMPPDELKVKRDKLQKPTEFTDLVWRKMEEVLEAETGRRNFTVVLSQLIDKHNRAGYERMAAAHRTKKTGKRKFVGPAGQAKLYIPGTEPAGWVQKKNRMTS